MILLLLTVPAFGCARHKAKARKAAPVFNGPAPGQKPILTPETALVGKVVRVNPRLRFVVLNFPIGHLPAVEQRLNLYRLGLKTGEIRVTGPQLDDNIVGELIAGEAQPGDEVRDR